MEGYDELSEMAASDRAEKLERKAIVAWLRPRVDSIDTYEQGEWGSAMASAVRQMDELLDAIERGDHHEDD